MNFKTAKIILNIPEKYDEKILKKHYRLMALKHHPDKNANSVEAKEKFVEIQDAYEFLKMNLEHNEKVETHEQNNYSNIFNHFFQSLFDGNIHSDLIMKLIQTLAFNYDGFVMNSLGKEMLQKLDNETAIYLYEVLCKYQHIIGLSDEKLSFIKKMVNERIKEDLIIVLNPSLKDLLHDNIYVLNHEGSKYYIPLWHSELHYQNKGKELIVICKPELPSNVELQEDGDLVVVVRENINNIFINKKILCTLGNIEFCINSDELKLTKYQHYIIKNRGVSCINTQDLYDNSVRGNIHFIIELYT